MNNPVMYSDPDGEWIHIALGAFIGGIVNLATNWDNCQGFWEYAAAFGVGASSGALAAATGGASIGVQLGVAAGTSALTSGVNSVIAQTNGNFKGEVDWDKVGQNSIIGGFSGLASFGASYATSNLFKGDIIVGGNVRIRGRSIPGQMIKRGLSGFAGGYAGGFTAGFLYSGDFSQAHQAGRKGGWLGGYISAGIGAGVAYHNSQQQGFNPWTGKYNIDFRKNSLPHGFRTIHNMQDNPQNRELILSTANNRNNTLYGPDVNGNYWRTITITIEVEVQIWVEIRDNLIIDFGANPAGGYYQYNPEINQWILKP